jgi:hypothetical protein
MARGKQRPGSMDRIRAAILEDSGARSALYKWLRRNHKQFSETLAEAGRPDWSVIARAFGEEGLTDGDGKPPSKEGARQTWYKVKKDLVSAARRKAGGVTRGVAVVQDPPSSQIPPPRPPAQESKAQETAQGPATTASSISGMFEQADAALRPWLPKRKQPKKE